MNWRYDGDTERLLDNLDGLPQRAWREMPDRVVREQLPSAERDGIEGLLRTSSVGLPVYVAEISVHARKRWLRTQRRYTLRLFAGAPYLHPPVHEESGDRVRELYERIRG